MAFANLAGRGVLGLLTPPSALPGNEWTQPSEAGQGELSMFSATTPVGDRGDSLAVDFFYPPFCTLGV